MRGLGLRAFFRAALVFFGLEVEPPTLPMQARQCNALPHVGQVGVTAGLRMEARLAIVLKADRWKRRVHALSSLAWRMAARASSSVAHSRTSSPL